MEKQYRVDESPKMLRIDASNNELFKLETSLLNGEKLPVKLRCRLAKETQNPQVLWTCVLDKAITVVRAAKENQLLTEAMINEIKRREKEYNARNSINNTSSQDTPLIPEQVQTIHEDKKSQNKGCIWLIIAMGVVGLLLTYLAGESWF